MSRFKKFMLLACVWLIGFVVGHGGVAMYGSQVFKAWEWHENDLPIIANCYGEDFNEWYIKRGTDYWENKVGQQIGFILQDPPKDLCKHQMLDGFIIFRKSRALDPGTIASTKRRTRMGRILAAEVRFSPGSFKLDLIVEHELGHAFGFGHIEEEGHIMHPSYGKMGPKFWVP